VSGRRVAVRIYAGMLRAFPPRHRRTYASEMIDMFETELAARMRAGHRWDVVRFVLAAWLNAIAAGFGERRRHRDARSMSMAWLSSLDVVLAWRMLLRYPGLSLVSVFGIAVGIAIAGGAFIVVTALTDPGLPLPGGDRTVSLLNWDASTNNREARMMADLASFRTVQSLEEVSVSRTVERNLIADRAAPETVTVAELSPSAFRVAGVAALRGRYLLPEDARPGAPDVIVIGHGEWLRRFGADPAIVGRSIRLGSTAFSVVGVMPEGFGFPVNHGFWIPSRLEASPYEPRSGPPVSMFARLAAGATLESAQAELDAITARMAAASPSTHAHLRSRVLPYAHAFNVMDDPENAISLNVIQGLLVLLLIVVSVNVSILVYARTATRQGEIAVRGALGASRRRIVGQLFVEALMLAGVAAALGIGVLSVALGQLEAAVLPLAGRMPFWMSFQLSTSGLIYIVVLTLVAAAIVGVAPALKATGRDVHTRLQGLSPGSGSRMQMGRVWTLLIVAQVALTVALLPAALFHGWTTMRFRTGDAGFASKQFLTAWLDLDRATVASSETGEREFRNRYTAVYADLERRLRAEPLVADVTASMVMPGAELAVVLEVEGQAAPPDPVDYNVHEGSKQGHLVRFNRVANNFFDAFSVPLVMGRGFGPADLGPGRSEGVIVNHALVDTLFDGANPLGHRIRYVGLSREAAAHHVVLDRWYEVIGVVPDFPTARTLDVERVLRIYHAASPGEIYPALLSVRLRGAEPAAFAGTFRQISVEADPDLQVRDLSTADEAMKREQGLMRMIGTTIAAVMSSVVVLSAAGIYALMSFTVARRRREIGIRAALGADQTRLLAGIFSRALAQLGVGAAAGMAGAFGLELLFEGEMFQGQGAVILPIVVVFMTTMGVLAASGPARQGLRIQPTEALREE
jgi:putative ABC transport system permease protein